MPCFVNSSVDCTLQSIVISFLHLTEVRNQRVQKDPPEEASHDMVSEPANIYQSLLAQSQIPFYGIDGLFVVNKSLMLQTGSNLY